MNHEDMLTQINVLYTSPLKKQELFDATLELFISKFTYDDKDLALKESIEWAKKIVEAVEKEIP